MAAKKKRKFPGPWKETHKEMTGEFYISKMRGQLRIVPVYQRHLRRVTDRYGNVDTMHEEFRGYDIMYTLQKLKIPEKSETILALLHGVMEVFESLVRQHDNYIWRAEEAEKKRRKAEYAKKKQVWDERKEFDTRKQKLMNKEFIRRVEV